MSDDVRARIRWRRWVVGVFLSLMALLLVVHWSWSIGARRRLNAQVAAYRAAGEPVEPQDFVVTGVAGADNAVLDLRAAHAALDRNSAAWKTLQELAQEPALPLRPEELALLGKVIAENQGVFPKVESATTRPGVDWQIAFATPIILTLLPDLNEQRELARFLRADALLAHAQGDHARAVRRVEQILFISRAVGKQPFLVGNLVSIGLSAMSTDLATDLAPDLRVGAGGEPGAATPQQVRELIARLLDESALLESHRNGLLGERMAQLEAARSFSQGLIGTNGAPPAKGAGLVGTLYKPTALGDGRLMMRHTTAMLEASTTSATWPQFKQKAPAFPMKVKEKYWLHLVAAIFMPSLDRAVATHYRALAERRMTAVVLALRLYAVEHDGQSPDALEQLVPAYLPAVPHDPMAPTTQPLGYAARAGGPIVYSVGENGVDDGGSEQLPPGRRSDQPQRWELLDAVTHATRQPRPAPPPAMDEGWVDEELMLEPTTNPTTEPSAESIAP